MVSLRCERTLFTIVIALALSASLRADDLTVEPRTVRVDDSVSITVSLEGAFAANDSVRLPVRNLVLEGPPAVSSEFSWINGAVTRRKVFRFAARPMQPGLAVAGPVVVDGEGGQRETLAAVTLQVIAETANVSNEPEKILHDLLANGREPMFLVTEIDKTTAAIGEEIVVTWVLYNAATVERWQVGNAPKLDAFWTEEIEVRNEQPEHVVIDGIELERVPIRRVALFPLRSGQLRIGGMGVRAAVMRRIDTGGAFSVFEGTMVETGFESVPVTVEVHGFGGGATPDAVGSVTLSCTTPLQNAGGPVAFTATLSGRGNLRGVPPPHLDGSVDGELQVEPLPLSVQRARNGVTMIRKWQYLVFPLHPGPLTIPPLRSSIYDPARNSVVVQRCGGGTLNVVEARRPATQSKAEPMTSRIELRDGLPWAAAIAAVVIAALLILPRLRRTLRTRREARRLCEGRTAREIREAVHAMLVARGLDVTALAVEASDRGDAYRAFRSLADALERDRLSESDSAAELRRRVRDLIETPGAS